MVSCAFCYCFRISRVPLIRFLSYATLCGYDLGLAGEANPKLQNDCLALFFVFLVWQVRFPLLFASGKVGIR